ncbi:MAG: hypothetical protein M3Z30_03175, partial [Gemmatimonadota bacterium]|nr:hypothetical protein [Gemmatimonadota bacterium]
MLKIRGLLLVWLPLATVGAQSRGTVNESRVISQKDGGKPDTVVMRTISTGTRTREDFSGPGTLQEPWRTMGTTQILVINDSTTTMTYLDSAKKSYWTTNLSAAMTAIGKNIDFKMESDTGASVTLDSVDQGEVIAGYKTVHFRGHSTHRMTMNILGAPTAWNVQTTTDYYVAPGFSPDSLELSSSSASKRALEIATASIAPGIKALVARNRSAMERMTKLGTTVKTVT